MDALYLYMYMYIYACVFLSWHAHCQAPVAFERNLAAFTPLVLHVKHADSQKIIFKMVQGHYRFLRLLKDNEYDRAEETGTVHPTFLRMPCLTYAHACCF